MADNDPEKRASLAPAPVFANRFHILRMQDGTGRIAFGETIDGVTVFHSAVRAVDADMVALRDLLAQIYPPSDKVN
jgi:hypothetical protein